MKQVFLVHAASKYRFRFPRKDLGNHTSESKKKKRKKILQDGCNERFSIKDLQFLALQMCGFHTSLRPNN